MSDTPETIEQLQASVRDTLRTLPPDVLEYVLCSMRVAYLTGRQEALKQSVADLKEIMA